MDKQKQLFEKHATLTAMLTKLAAENRGPNDGEKAELEQLQKDVSALKAESDNEGRRRFADNLDKLERKDGIVMLRKGESLEKIISASSDYPEEWNHLSLGKLLKGITFGDWTGAALERKAQSESSSGSGGVFIPSPVAARVIDLARNKARVFQAGAQTIPMDTAKLTVPRLDSDITGSWTSEGSDISQVDATFDGVTFTAHKLGVIAAIDNELLEDAPNSAAAIENSIAKAAALALDLAALTGSGSGATPQGLVNDSNVSTVTAIGSVTNWDKLAAAAQTIRGYNFEPNGYVISPATYSMFANLKDTLNQPMRPQSTLDGVGPLITNQAASGYFYMGQFDEMAFGLRAGMRIEVSREGSYMGGSPTTLNSVFSKDQTMFRLVIRGDWQRLHPKAFVVGSGITVS